MKGGTIVDYETKKNALFLETVVLVNGESDPEMYKDSQGDVWDSRTIGQVFTTEANQTNHDLYHNKTKIEGIQTIANYRNKNVENIGGRDVPINSWRKDIMVTDDEVIELIKSNQINGISPNNTLQQCPICVDELKNIEGNIFYNSDIENKECMNPIFTSLVSDPANGYGMNVYSYDKFLEKSKSSEDGKLSKKLKEMFKGFGESVLNLANEMDETEQEGIEEQNVEVEENEETTNEQEEIEETVEEITGTNLEQEVAELKKSVEKQANEISELKKSSVVKETDSLDNRRKDIENAIVEKHFSEDDKYDIWIDLMTEDSVIIRKYDENKDYKVDYSMGSDGVTVGDLEEVELQYVPVGSTEEEDDEESEESTEENTPESQKSRQPQIRTPKLENVGMEKQTETKTNHFGMPVKTTKELAKAKNQFNF